MPELSLSELKEKAKQLDKEVNDGIEELKKKQEELLRLHVKLLTSKLLLCCVYDIELETSSEEIEINE